MRFLLPQESPNASPSLVGLASHIANSSGRVHRHRGRLANADSPKALVRRSLEVALSEDVVAAVEGGRDEDVGDEDVVGGYESSRVSHM